MRIGSAIFGLASMAAGALDLAWGEFEPAHQPLHAWGDHIPGMTVMAYLAALWLILGGAAMLWRQTERGGAAALTILYCIFVLFPLPRFVTAPHYLGYRLSVYIGVTANLCMEVVLAAGAAIAWASLRGPVSPVAARALRVIFGLCSVFFGLGHFAAIQATQAMIPKWLPGGTFWVLLTGTAFLLAGLAILFGVLDALAAWLLGTMLLVFSVVLLTPGIFVHPHNHVAWGGDAYNLTVAGAAWIVAEWLGGRRVAVESASRPEPSLA